MEDYTRDLCYQHYCAEGDPFYRMKFLDILLGMLGEEKERLAKQIQGVSVPNTKRGNK